MTGVNKPSSHCLRKKRRQVLNNNRKIEYNHKYYSFKHMKYSEHTFLNNFYIDMCKKSASINCPPSFYCPEGYPWRKGTPHLLFNRNFSNHPDIIIVLPRNWLLHYNPSIPIALGGWCNPFYLDLEKQSYTFVVLCLIRNRFYLHAGISPYFIRNCNKDWCITYLNFHPSYTRTIFFRSFLLIKNMDFSKLDAHIEANDLKCPVNYDSSIQVKDKPEIQIVGHNYNSKIKKHCSCVNCRKIYLAIEVDVKLTLYGVSLELRDPIYEE